MAYQRAQKFRKDLLELKNRAAKSTASSRLVIRVGNDTFLDQCRQVLEADIFLCASRGDFCSIAMVAATSARRFIVAPDSVSMNSAGASLDYYLAIKTEILPLRDAFMIPESTATLLYESHVADVNAMITGLKAAVSRIWEHRLSAPIVSPEKARMQQEESFERMFGFVK